MSRPRPRNSRCARHQRADAFVRRSRPAKPIVMGPAGSGSGCGQLRIHAGPGISAILLPGMPICSRAARSSGFAPKSRPVAVEQKCSRSRSWPANKAAARLAAGESVAKPSQARLSAAGQLQPRQPRRARNTAEPTVGVRVLGRSPFPRAGVPDGGERGQRRGRPRRKSGMQHEALRREISAASVPRGSGEREQQSRLRGQRALIGGAGAAKAQSSDTTQESAPAARGFRCRRGKSCCGRSIKPIRCGLLAFQLMTGRVSISLW